MKTNSCLDKEMEYMIRFLETKMIVDNQVMDKIRLFTESRKSIWISYLKQSKKILVP